MSAAQQQQPMVPTSNVDFSHDAYMHEYKDQQFHGYQGHLAYLDYFVKTDVSRREGQHIITEQKQNNSQEGGGEKQPEQHQIQAQNKPLIIAGDEGCGKTALISKWITHSSLFQQKHNKHMILLVHVAGASSCERKYQSFIHRALVKLRRTFPDVQTRLVHIIDDKLRINFSRCLDLVSNAIGNTSGNSASAAGSSTGLQEADTERESGSRDGRIIMILDGLENFRDSDNDTGVDTEQSADWVPWSFPDRFRVIILTRKRSKAMNHFKLRKCPLLYMGDQFQFSFNEIGMIINEHVGKWQPQLTQGSVESFEGRLAIIRQELVIKREAQFKEQQSKKQQKEHQSDDHIILFKSLEDELKEGNFHVLARPADELEVQYAKPTERQLNPLVIRCILYFYLYCGSSAYTSPQGLRALDMKIILGCKTLHQLFVTAIKHFRDCLFTVKHHITTPQSHTSNKVSEKGNNLEQAREKFDQLLSYLLVSRKGITWNELKELINNLTDEDIKLFQEIFGFLLISYVPENGGQAFMFYKHPSFKKAVKETIETVKIDQSRAQLHKNLAAMIEKQEPTNQFLWQRRVDELCFHYQMSGQWIKLKDLISSVEVFSTMFVVPELRYELAQQWLWLLGQQTGGAQAAAGNNKSSKQQCDPVVEYNKALESFIIKYRPTSKELFVIMIQLCRFFKEDLAELVSGADASEPQFAHPSLLGTREMDAIRLLREVERLDGLFIHDREEDALQTINNNNKITTSSQLIASLKGFNLDNAIVREQIIDMLRKEVRSQSSAKEHQMISMIDEDSTTHYHYKRWLWVQFPWCTIDVHSDISNIMELFSGGSGQGADSNLYISATKENELAKATLAILHAAKQRSKKSYGNKSLDKSQSQSISLSQSQKKKGRTSNMRNNKPGMLPPVIPQSAKNKNDSMTLNNNSLSKTFAGNRSASAGKGQGILPMLRLDSEDRRSPEKTLAKISTTMAVIEQGKMKEIEQENVLLGAQLNSLNFQIYRKEKELKQLEEHYNAIQIENSINSEGERKLEVMEAKLLKAYEELNRVEVERKRIEQIVKACEKNPPNNEEQIRNLEQQIDVFVKLIAYHQGLMSNAHKEQEQYKKQYHELIGEMQKQEHERQAQIHRITDFIDRKKKLQSLMIEGEEERKNFAMFPTESVEIDTGKLKQRQIHYKKWKAKLNVTKAFISEKRLLFENSFRKMIDIAGLRKIDAQSLLVKESPLQNLEGLIGFIERANDLDKSKKQKEMKIEKLKREKEELSMELRKWENGVQLIECGHIERAQKKLYLEEKSLRSAKDEQQRQLSLVADLKVCEFVDFDFDYQSGFVNVAKILGIEEGLETESDQTKLIEKICEKFTKLEQQKNGSSNQMDNLSVGGPNGTHPGSAESNRSSSKVEEGSHILSPNNLRTRKRQPKQKQSNFELPIGGKQSPHVGSTQLSNANIAAGLPMKLTEIKDHDVDSDSEERFQMLQDRMRIKKTISNTGNYTLTKVPAQGSSTNAPLASADAVKDQALPKQRTSSQGKAQLEKFKRNNLTASNPIIGAPLGDKSMSQKYYPKMVQSSIQIKSRDASASKLQPVLHSNSMTTKPALANTKIPKYVKKTIKFAKGTEGGESGRNQD